MAAKKKIEAESNFEKDLEVLEKLVEELEEGGLPLDVSITKFEEGMRLAQRCDKALSAAEKKIEILTKNADGDLEAQPFDEAAGAESSPEKPEKKRKAAAPAEDGGDTEGEKDPGALLF